jgi:hypothetical protein
MTTMKTDNGGPAFPRPASEFTANGTLPDGNDLGAQDGMSLRDYFAAQALNGLIQFQAELRGVGGQEIADLTAQAAYALADAMLNARK